MPFYFFLYLLSSSFLFSIFLSCSIARRKSKCSFPFDHYLIEPSSQISPSPKTKTYVGGSEESSHRCIHFIHWIFHELTTSRYISFHTFLLQVSHLVLEYKISKPKNFTSPKNFSDNYFILHIIIVHIFLSKEFRLSPNSSASKPDDFTSDSCHKSCFLVVTTRHWWPNSAHPFKL